MELVISSGTVTCLAISAALCVALPFIIWIYMWGRVRFSQAIFGFLFSCAVVGLENLLDSIFLKEGGYLLSNPMANGIYIAVSLALLQTLGLFGGSLCLRSKYESADAAVGLAVGFAIMELFVAALSNVMSYALALYCNNNGIDAMSAAIEPENLQNMLSELQVIAETPATTYLLSGFNRVAYTIQIVSLGVLAWFAAKDFNRLWTLALAVALQSLVRLPYGLYTAGVYDNFIREEVLTYLLTAVLAAAAALVYNKLEPKTYKFKAERLRNRRRR